MLQVPYNHLFSWAIALIVGFPLLVIGLGELIYRLQRRAKPLADTLRVIRNLVLPVFVLMLFVQQVLNRPASDALVKSIQTLFWLCVIHAALCLLNAVLFEQAKGDTWQSRVPKLLIDLFRLFLVLLGGAIILATVWQADLAGVVTALGISSIVIGLALQDTLGSVTSGIALLFERPFTVGDWLRVGDLVGQVIDINWRAVRLQTFEREIDILPLKAGEFFGEMTLFSSELSPISVTAVDDLEVMMIPATVVNQMIERQPSFAREISQILELRRRTVQAVKQTGAESPQSFNS